jgi:nicotinamidase-related amidase
MTRYEPDITALAAGPLDRPAQNTFQITPKCAALVVVDLQYGTLSIDGGYSRIYSDIGLRPIVDSFITTAHETMLPKVCALQKAFRGAGAPVIFMTVGSIIGDLSDMPTRFRRAAAFWKEKGLTAPWGKVGTRDMEVVAEVAPLPGELVIPKPGASGFSSSPLERVLRARGIRELVFCGVATSYCVESNVREACDRGFDCILVEDACMDPIPPRHERSIEACRDFGRVEKTATVISELMKAGAAAPPVA